MKSFALFSIFLLFSSTFAQHISDSKRHYPYADIVLVIDQYTNADDLVNWINTLLPQLEANMNSFGLGVSGNNVSTTNQNRYGLVVFGIASQPRSILIQGQEFVPLNIFVNNLRSLLSTSLVSIPSNYDGYAAMKLALSYPWRSNSMHMVHLITPRWRQIIDPTITQNLLITQMQQLNIILEIFVSSAFTTSTIKIQQRLPLPAQGLPQTFGINLIDKQRTSFYISDSSSGNLNIQSTINNARIDGENSVFTVVDDYVELVEEISREGCKNKNRTAGAAFDIRMAFMNSAQFNRAFVLSHSLILSALLHNNNITPGEHGTCPLQPESYINYGNSTFYINKNLQSRQQAIQSCQLLDGILADVNDQNVNDLTLFVENNYIVNTNPVWINSWNTNTYGGGSLALIRNTAVLRENSNDLLPSICQITPAYLGCQ